jgi:ribosomal-protein-alanine N-acetyltransferase
MKLTLLSQCHLNQLMAFEYQNKTWFEQFISSRGPAFYQKSAIEQHIHDNISAYQLNKQYPGLVINEGIIMARINLKYIDLTSNSAEIGYRVAQQYTGAGIASFGLKSIIKIAKTRFRSFYFQGDFDKK